MSDDTVRHDLYSVQEWGNGFQHWTHVALCRSLTTAEVIKAGLGPILGFSHRARIVHPTQKVVDVYVAAGNEIHE